MNSKSIKILQKYNKNLLISVYQRLNYQKNFINYNTNIIFIMIALFIKITNIKENKKLDLCKYQGLIEKSIYFAYKIRTNIIFLIKKLSR